MTRIAEVRTDLGRAIKKQRQRQGITQEQLAELADVSPRSLQRLEVGKLARLTVVVKVADALKVPVWRLFKP